MVHNKVQEVRKLSDLARDVSKTDRLQDQDLALIAKAVEMPWWKRLYARLFKDRYQAKLDADWARFVDGLHSESWMGCPEADLTRGGTLSGRKVNGQWVIDVGDKQITLDEYRKLRESDK
jgi:hypothetical protein